jgi:hypothetical protein
MKTIDINNDATRILKNINGLSLGDRANCGRYGVVECYRSARNTVSGVRKFKVSKSEVLANRGNWTMSSLRSAITAVR